MYLERLSLENRIAVVVGGAGGIGYASAEALYEAGATVAIADLDLSAAEQAAVKLAQSQSRPGSAFGVDIREPRSVIDLGKQVSTALGRVDILVNSAGICVNTAAEDVDDDEWSNIIDVNLNGVFRCCREFGQLMLNQGSGAIVNIGSMSGLVANRPQPQAGYNASKSAVHMLTKSLAAEWAHAGVRVNAIAPGYIATELTKRGMSNREWARMWLDMTPMKRLGEPSEVASLVLFLASDAASYITGSIVSVDGGYTSW